jgi:hypothetical protein
MVRVSAPTGEVVNVLHDILESDAGGVLNVDADLTGRAGRLHEEAAPAFRTEPPRMLKFSPGFSSNPTDLNSIREAVRRTIFDRSTHGCAVQAASN